MTLDSSSLDTADRAVLERLLQESRFTSLPPQVGAAPPGAADYRTFEITVEDQDRVHTVRAVEPIGDPALQRLVNFLEQHGRVHRSS
jgi:hypothetical protein